jgi:hypothetical protein
MGRGNPVIIVKDYGLDGQYFSLFHSVQNGCGAHPTSYPIGNGGLFPLR